MTLQDIIKTYMEYRGLVYRYGKTTLVTPIIPLIVMDKELEIFTKKVAPLPLKHEWKKMRKDWAEDYRAFNTSFLSVFSDEQKDFIIDKMDELWDALDNDLTILKIALMDLFPNEPLESQDTLASVLLCGVLAQMASIIWQESFMTGRMQKDVNPHLENIRRYSRNLCSYLYRGEDDVRPNESERVQSAAQVLIRKMEKWIINESQ